LLPSHLPHHPVAAIRGAVPLAKLTIIRPAPFKATRAASAAFLGENGHFERKEISCCNSNTNGGSARYIRLHLDHLIKESEPAHIAKNDENDARIAR